MSQYTDMRTDIQIILLAGIISDIALPLEYIDRGGQG
jgi:hypothetical protein